MCYLLFKRETLLYKQTQFSYPVIVNLKKKKKKVQMFSFLFFSVEGEKLQVA